MKIASGEDGGYGGRYGTDELVPVMRMASSKDDVKEIEQKS